MLGELEGSEDMCIKLQNLSPVHVDEFEAWQRQHGFVCDASQARTQDIEAMLRKKISNEETCLKNEPSRVERCPGPNGNPFDAAITGVSGHAAMEVAGVLKKQGVCVCEGNMSFELLSAAFNEAEMLWNTGGFVPPMQDMGATELEACIWQQVLYEDEKKVFWVCQESDRIE